MMFEIIAVGQGCGGSRGAMCNLVGLLIVHAFCVSLLRNIITDFTLLGD